MKKFSLILIILLLTVLLVYFLGPKPPKPVISSQLPSVSVTLDKMDEYIKKLDSEGTVKPDNGSRILWASDSLKQATEYVLLYLHGFSASWYEGFPANYEFTSHFKCNAYIPRLATHGLVTEDPLMDMTPDKLWESAKEALVVAQMLGKKVVIMSTSTGGTLALKLAAEFPDIIHGLILYSPNIAINNSAAFLLSKPWGLQIGRKVTGSNFRTVNPHFDSKECQFWYCKYRMEATVYLQQLVEATMTKKTFQKVKAPVFLAYYYKDEEHQDPIVRVDAMLDMFKNLGTPENMKRAVAFPEANTHVIACELMSKSYNEVIRETLKFSEEILGMKP